MDSIFSKVLNRYFDKVIVLTIERNKHRLNIIDKILSGLDYDVFIGVDGKQLDLTELQQSNQVSANINEIYAETNSAYLNMASPPIHINQVACAMSHVEIYKYLLNKKGCDRILILEDDVIPVEQHLKYLEDTLKSVPNDWEVLYLGYMLNDDFSFLGNLKYHTLVTLLTSVGIKTSMLSRKQQTFPVPFSKFLRKHGAHTGTHAYGVTQSALPKLIAMQTPLQQVAPDLLLIDAIVKNKITSYTTKYLFFDQNNSLHSSIWDK
ncbi:hypothetical protein EON73_01145 [bacterium]|nr:MAG: hypothetical protein EON73_01145 [bacterium]